jgi:hypothetical protein
MYTSSNAMKANTYLQEKKKKKELLAKLSIDAEICTEILLWSKLEARTNNREIFNRFTITEL